MKNSDTFSERRQEAETAKVRLLEKFKARPVQNSPEVVERAAARQAQSAAQAEHSAAVELRKRNKAQKLRDEAEAVAEASRHAEQKSADQIRLAEDQRLKRAAEAEVAQKALDEASRKAKRDARYANRKAGT